MRKIVYIMVVLAAVLALRADGTRQKPNIILITVDTLRADRLSCYGYEHPTSPHLDKLIGKGVMFNNAITNVPLTSPSFSSMFTSKYPHEIGSIRNGIPMVDGHTTLAEIFKKQGYHTAAFISNWPLKRHLSKLDKGFDIYEDDFHEKRWLFFNDERDAEEVSDLAIEWFEDGPEEPYFVWIHYSDPHAPYVRHSEFTFSEDVTSDNANYDTEVAYTDHHMGRLIDLLYKKKVLGNSMVIFTADHGESLGEHDYTGHGRKVYQPGLWVPFAVMGKGVPRGVKEDANIQLLDLAPTIMSYAGIEAPGDMRGEDLMPCIRGVAKCPERALYYETYPGAAPQLKGMDQMLTRPIWVGRLSGSEKLIYSARYQNWEKYDIGRDPKELDNLVKLRDPEFIKESDELLGWYREWEDETVVGEVDAMTEEDRKKFKALGYVDSP